MARKKQKKPKAPPLSLADRRLYRVMVWGSMLGSWVYWFTVDACKHATAFLSGHIIAYSYDLWGLVYGCAGLALAFLFIWMREKRYPVFGNREVMYGPPQYNEVYPLLGRHEVSCHPSEEWKKTAATLKCLWLLSFTVLLSGLLLITPAYVLTEEDSVEVRNRLGRITETYTVEQITSMELEMLRIRYVCDVGMRLEMADGEEFFFRSDHMDFTIDPETGENRVLTTMQRIKDQLPPAAITIEGVDSLPEVVEDWSMSPAEEAQLYALFETELP